MTALLLDHIHLWTNLSWDTIRDELAHRSICIVGQKNMKIVGSSIQLAYDLMLVVSIIYFFYHLKYCYYIFYFNKYIGPSHLVLIDNVTMNSCVKELCWTPSWTKVQFSPRSQAQLLDIKQECHDTQAWFQAKPDELTRAFLAKVIDDLYISKCQLCCQNQ